MNMGHLCHEYKRGCILKVTFLTASYPIYLSACPQPHVAMLHTHDGTFQNCCDTSKLHATCCDAFSNMLEFMLPILEYLSHLLSNFETVCSIVMFI